MKIGWTSSNSFEFRIFERVINIKKHREVKTELTEIEKESIDKLVDVYRQELTDQVMNAPIANRQGVNVENITNAVLHYYGVTKNSLYSRDRKAHIVKCRAVVFWLLRQPEMETGLSITRIAEMAFMNHASVIHNIKRIDNELMYEDKYTVAELTEILRTLGFRFFKQGTKFVIK